MSVETFQALVVPVADAIAGQPVEPALAALLNDRFPPAGPAFQAIEQACHAAIAEGWMCAHGPANARYGRVIKPSPATAQLSVDVVDLTDIAGPHHLHPKGEICMIMPIDAGAQFDGHGIGWSVYPPGSGHRPTVSGGRALVLYLLPDGKIEFTK